MFEWIRALKCWLRAAREGGDCFRLDTPNDYCLPIVAMQKDQLPALIVYSARYPQHLGVPYRARVTNRADELFEFVLDAVEQRQLVVDTR